MKRLSNSLTDLAERVRIAERECADAEKTAAAKAIETGFLLIEAKQSCKQGEWLPFLERAEMPERKAQRYMQLARTGLKPDTVSDLGGIKAALEWAEGLRLPSSGEYLLIYLSDILRGCVWLDPEEGFRVNVFGEGFRYLEAPTRPMVKEYAVLPALYFMLDYQHSNMRFCIHNRAEVDAAMEALLQGQFDLAIERGLTCQHCGERVERVIEHDHLTVAEEVRETPEGTLLVRIN